MELKDCMKRGQSIKLLLSLLVSLSLIGPTTAIADDCIVIGEDQKFALAECKQELSKTVKICDMVLTACEGYVNELENTIRLKDLKIAVLENQNADYTIMLDEEYSTPDLWFEQPIITGILGLVIGAAAWESVR